MKWTLILAAAAVALLLVIAGCKTTQQSTVPQENNSSTVAATPAPAPSAPTNGVAMAADEASCPVLGTIMKKSQMIPIEYKGKTYYMCCAPCKKKFNENPEQYIAHPVAPNRNGM